MATRIVRYTDWGAWVQRWNALKRYQRTEHDAVCRAEGHDWRMTDNGRPICRRCCRWGGE